MEHHHFESENQTISMVPLFLLPEGTPQCLGWSRIAPTGGERDGLSLGLPPEGLLQVAHLSLELFDLPRSAVIGPAGSISRRSRLSMTLPHLAL